MNKTVRRYITNRFWDLSAIIDEIKSDLPDEACDKIILAEDEIQKAKNIFESEAKKKAGVKKYE